MSKNHHILLPSYCQPDFFLPKIPETKVLFKQRPFLFQDFIAKTMSFLQSEKFYKMGFNFNTNSILPCKWHCVDESVFGVDLYLFAYTGQYPFDKGAIGGMFNENSLGAAVHHSGINVDFGGSHVGYMPGKEGGHFGTIWRPLCQDYSTNCGYLMHLLEPFKKVYKDACQGILLYKSNDDIVRISIPNEFLHPSYSNNHIKLLVNLDSLVTTEVECEYNRQDNYTQVGRSVFYLNPNFLDELSYEKVQEFSTSLLTPIGSALTSAYFNIFDSTVQLDKTGQPEQKVLLYMKYILAAQHSPAALKAAIVNTYLNQNKLINIIGQEQFLLYNFISFTGIFIDLYNDDLQNYVNLFQPMSLIIKPRGQIRKIEMCGEELFHILKQQPSAPFIVPFEDVFNIERCKTSLNKFTYRPESFSRK